MEEHIKLVESDNDNLDNEIETTPYKYMERKLVTQPYDMSVHTMIEQIVNADIILDPDYQRRYRWDHIRASRFVESLLLNIPIPTIFLAEEEDMTYSVIDGQQRLTTLYKFIKLNEFMLEGLQVRSDLNNKKFDDINKRDQGKLLKQYLRCSVILNDSDPQIKFDVFERLNSGSAALTEQEIRNCVYRGSFNNMLKELAENKDFIRMLGLREEKVLNMTNVEYVLRFFSYRQAIDSYDGSVKEFFNNFMKENKNISNEQVAYFKKVFSDTISSINFILNDNAFKRYIPERKGWHGALNRAVFDAEMVAFSKFKFNNLDLTDIVAINNDIKRLMEDYSFINSIKSSTNAPEKVRYRIEKMKNCLSKYGESIE